MQKTLQLIVPALVAVSIALIVPHLRSEGGCSCHAPVIVFGSILGCSDSKQPERSTTAVKADGSVSVSDAALYKKIGKAGHKVTFVEIGSVNCIPCKMMQPIMEAVEEEYKGQVKIVFFDVWTEWGKAGAMKYKARVIPTQVFLDKDGNEYYRHEGFFPKEDLVNVLKMKGVQ